MALTVNGHSPKGYPALPVSSLMVFHAFRLEHVKSIFRTVPSHRVRLLFSSLAIRVVAVIVCCTAARGLSDAKESFLFFVPAWYAEFPLTMRDTLSCGFEVQTAEKLVGCIYLTSGGGSLLESL